MPPKKKPTEPSKKADLKKKEKVIEDKTFGLKNKKGAKNQKFIQQVQNQVKFGNQSAKKVDQKVAEKKKDEKKKELDELNNLFRPVTVQKVEKGIDPKSVLCAFYKQGQCTKGDKCKFSHDLSLERKSEKRNIYVDVRDDNDEDGMENWDEEKLKEVVEKKHGESDRKLPKTDIICKFFLDALEYNKYGWFWECPNGAICHYRHALPSGFVLKRDKKKEEKKEEISIEDLVETQRAQLGHNLTWITLDSFLEWKKKKLREKKDRDEKEENRKRAEFKAGRHVGLSGRDMFTFRPEMAVEDETEEGEMAFNILPREDDDILACQEVSAEYFTGQARDVDDSGTVASVRHWQNEKEATLQAEGGGSDGEDDETKDAAPIDENLFEDDLEDLEDDLENLDVN